MEHLESIVRDVVAECEDDYVGLWSIIKRARNSGVVSAEIKTTTLNILNELLQGRNIDAGQFENNVFVRWKGPRQEILKRIEHEWLQLGGEPTIGDVVWFVASTH